MTPSLFPFAATAALLLCGHFASAQIIPWSAPPEFEDEKNFPTRVSPHRTGPTLKAAFKKIAPKKTAPEKIDLEKIDLEIPVPAPSEPIFAQIFQALPASPASLLLSSFNADAGSGSVRTNTSWISQVTQNSGSITVSGTAGDDNGWGATGLSLNATGMNFITITAQRAADNLAPSVFLQFEDRALNVQIFSVATSQFAVGVPTVVQIPISSWTINFGSSDITGWSIGGGSVGTVPFRLTFDEVAFSASAIPEPSTVALLAGLVALAAVGYRRRVSRQ